MATPTPKPSTNAFILSPPAQIGFSNASSYDQHRPNYLPAVVDSLLQHLDVVGQRDARIVEIGAGTGKFTEAIAAREEGFEILAVEPHEGMRGELVRKGLNGVSVVNGNAGAVPVDDEWGDAAIAAQAFHWFATEETLREIHRVLRPGAAFGMIWNIEHYNSPMDWPAATPWEQTLKEQIHAFDDGQPRFRDQKFKQVFEAQQDSSPLQTLKDTFTHHMPMFSLPLGEEKVDWTIWLNDEAIWERYRTLSQIAVLEGEELERVKKVVFDALKGEGVERNENGEVKLHGATYIYWTSRV